MWYGCFFLIPVSFGTLGPSKLLASSSKDSEDADTVGTVSVPPGRPPPKPLLSLWKLSEALQS